jgi:PHD/YefM family antitoxin component YafN of YafNO toxin-antitoxin module
VEGDSKAIRIPVSTAASKGVSALVDEVEKQRVILTSLGRPVAVVDSAERLDESVRAMRLAARTVVEMNAGTVASRASNVTLAEACTLLGVDIAAVVARAEEISRASDEMR